MLLRDWWSDANISCWAQLQKTEFINKERYKKVTGPDPALTSRWVNSTPLRGRQNEKGKLDSSK